MSTSMKDVGTDSGLSKSQWEYLLAALRSTCIHLHGQRSGEARPHQVWPLQLDGGLVGRSTTMIQVLEENFSVFGQMVESHVALLSSSDHSSDLGGLKIFLDVFDEFRLSPQHRQPAAHPTENAVPMTEDLTGLKALVRGAEVRGAETNGDGGCMDPDVGTARSVALAGLSFDLGQVQVEAEAWREQFLQFMSALFEWVSTRFVDFCKFLVEVLRLCRVCEEVPSLDRSGAWKALTLLYGVCWLLWLPGLVDSGRSVAEACSAAGPSIASWQARTSIVRHLETRHSAADRGIGTEATQASSAIDGTGSDTHFHALDGSNDTLATGGVHDEASITLECDYDFKAGDLDADWPDTCAASSCGDSILIEADRLRHCYGSNHGADASLFDSAAGEESLGAASDALYISAEAAAVGPESEPIPWNTFELYHLEPTISIAALQDSGLTIDPILEASSIPQHDAIMDEEQQTSHTELAEEPKSKETVVVEQARDAEPEDDISTSSVSEPPPAATTPTKAQLIRERQAPKNEMDEYYCDHVDCAGKLRIPTFVRRCEWSKHMDKHERPYRCLEAGCEKLQGFTYSGGLSRHEREVHKKHGGSGVQHLCPYESCKRSAGDGFTRRENLDEHLRRMHQHQQPHRGNSTPRAEASGSDGAGLKRRASLGTWKSINAVESVDGGDAEDDDGKRAKRRRTDREMGTPVVVSFPASSESPVSSTTLSFTSSSAANEAQRPEVRSRPGMEFNDFAKPTDEVSKKAASGRMLGEEVNGSGTAGGSEAVASAKTETVQQATAAVERPASGPGSGLELGTSSGPKAGLQTPDSAAVKELRREVRRLRREQREMKRAMKREMQHLHVLVHRLTKTVYH